MAALEKFLHDEPERTPVLIKAALALHHRTLPPSLHFQKPNPNIPFVRLGITVQSKLEAWSAPQGQARVAGVSSFGFGGTNATLVFKRLDA